MEIDNFDIFRSHLNFEKAKKFDSKMGNINVINDTYDRYIIQILCRAKDAGGKRMGVNTSNRLIKTYEVSSLEYFDKKKDHIITLCKDNMARAYILPQVRSTYDCLKEMIRIGIDNLENPTIKFQHILRSCMCSMHKSRDPKWIIDLDNDMMDEYICHDNFGGLSLNVKHWTVEEVLKLIKDLLKEAKKDENSAYVVKTKNGCHIITSPFNLKAASEQCNMFYEGVKKFVVGSEPSTNMSGFPDKDKIYKELTGWVHKDGMSLLYMDIPEK